MVLMLYGTWANASKPLPNPEYVPTIVNGLVASVSILMAIALFLLNQRYTNIKDEVKKTKFHLRATYYLFGLFFIMLFGIFLGIVSFWIIILELLLVGLWACS